MDALKEEARLRQHGLSTTAVQHPSERSSPFTIQPNVYQPIDRRLKVLLPHNGTVSDAKKGVLKRGTGSV